MRKFLRPLVLFVFLTLVIGYNNCGKVQFNNGPLTNLAAGAGNPDAPGSVCNPFGGASSVGIVANNIYYIDPTLINSIEAQGKSPMTLINNTVEEFFDPTNQNISIANVNLFLSAINFPAMYFTEGFTDAAGNSLHASDGSLLVQYFGFRAKSVFVPANWPPGDYQVASLTDDGSVTTFTGGQANGSDLVLNNDGAHSMQMGCSNSVLHVTANSQIPLTFDYFQGPPVTIGLMLMYRPVSVAGTILDPFCGKGGNADNYFFEDHDGSGNPISPSTPQAPYVQLTGAFNSATGSGGWNVIEAGHYTLPPGTPNGCQ